MRSFHQLLVILQRYSYARVDTGCAGKMLRHVG